MSGSQFFYHSFPRKRPGVDQAELGMRVLQGVLEYGLVLTPEKIEWAEELQGGNRAEPWVVSQERFCVTELSPQELMAHAQQFETPFAFEFDLSRLRALGACPVHYLPQGSSARPGLAGVGSTIVARLGEVQLLLERLAALQDAPLTDDMLILTRTAPDGAKQTAQIDCSGKGVRDLIAELAKGGSRSPKELVGALRGISQFFYPLDNDRAESGPGLEYYRQREWRLIGAILENLGPAAIGRPTEEETSFLIKSNPWFGEEIQLRTGKFTRAARSLVLRKNESGDPIHKSIRRVLVPKALQQRAESVANGRVCVEVAP